MPESQPPSIPPPASTVRWRRWALRLGKLVLLLLALWLAARLLAGLDWRDLEARMEGVSRPWLAAAVGALTARFLVWDERWRRAVARLGPVPPRWITLPSLLSAATVNTVTPTARVLGGVMRARHLARAVERLKLGGEGLDSGRAYGSVLYDQVAHQGVIGAVTWLTVIAAAAATGRPALAWGLTAALAVSLGILGVVLRRRATAAAGAELEAAPRSSAGAGASAEASSDADSTSGFVRWLAERIAGRAGGDAGAGLGDTVAGEEGGLRRLVTHGREAVRVVRRLLRDRRLAAEAVVLTLLFFVINASAQWMIFEAMGSEVSFLIVLAVVALGAIAGVAVGTPGGIGGAEAAMIASFTAFGVGRLDAVAGALLYRAFHFAVILALGVPSLVWLEVKLGRGPQTRDEAKNHPPK